jgi:hypothetical protein
VRGGRHDPTQQTALGEEASGGDTEFMDGFGGGFALASPKLLTIGLPAAV